MRKRFERTEEKIFCRWFERTFEGHAAACVFVCSVFASVLQAGHEEENGLWSGSRLVRCPLDFLCTLCQNGGFCFLGCVAVICVDKLVSN